MDSLILKGVDRIDIMDSPTHSHCLVFVFLNWL